MPKTLSKGAGPTAGRIFNQIGKKFQVTFRTFEMDRHCEVFAYLFGGAGLGCTMQDLPSSLWHAGSLAAACKLWVVACRIFSRFMQTLSCGMWDLVPWPGTKPGSPALGAQSLSLWTGRQVPARSWHRLASFFELYGDSKNIDNGCLITDLLGFFKKGFIKQKLFQLLMTKDSSLKIDTLSNWGSWLII